MLIALDSFNEGNRMRGRVGFLTAFRESWLIGVLLIHDRPPLSVAHEANRPLLSARILWLEVKPPIGLTPIAP
jgi:hypothetical protein